MTESKDLKQGETVEFIVDGKTLILEPIPYGRLKAVLKMVVSSIGEIAQGKDRPDVGTMVPELLMEKSAKIFPLLFDQKKHPYMSEEWVELNLTIPLAKDVFSKAIIINDLKDFFGKMGLQPGAAPREVQLSETAIPTPTI